MSATIDDVRDLLDTDLADQDIQPLLDRVAREISREYSATRSRTTPTALISRRRSQRIESPPVMIAGRRPSVGNASKTYETSLVDYLRAGNRPGSALLTARSRGDRRKDPLADRGYAAHDV